MPASGSMLGQPSRMDLALEAPRAMGELAGFVAVTPLLRTLSRGDDHPVLVLPGFLASDSSTIALRGLLRRLGYPAYGWRLGRNLGPTAEILDGTARSIQALSERHGQPISLVGWSLGGVFARVFARRHPDLVRQVISLGAPFNMADVSTSNANADYERLRHLHDVTSDIVMTYEPSPEPLSVPSTAVYTRTDGIVAWQTCVQVVDERSENVEVRGSHCGLGHNASVALVVADRLAQPVDDWTPFRPHWRQRIWFPAPVSGPPGWGMS